MSIIDLFHQAVYIQEPNRICFDYAVFKTFAQPPQYDAFTAYIIELMRQCIETHGGFEMHLNLSKFSVTAAQRYSEMIRVFCKQCLQSETEYSKLLIKLYIYNPPKILGSISALFVSFVDDNVKSKIVFA
jgi:hypothetical protein